MANCSVIIGTGSYIPTEVVKNERFCANTFRSPDGIPLEKPTPLIVQKLKEITGIMERRYVSDNLTTSDIATLAAKQAIDAAQIDPETLDVIVVAHNFADVKKGQRCTDMVPTLAARVKHNLEIANPYAVAYDLPFGCPGWVQGLIQSHQFMKAGDVKRALVIGAETLSRVSDPHDQDSMIYSDGAGAAVVERREYPQPVGILSHVTRSDTLEHAYLLHMDKSFHPTVQGNDLYLKMNGHQVYRYALKTVPPTVQQSLDKAGVSLQEVTKILIHQANEKMDDEIVNRLFSINGNKRLERDQMASVMPITISWLGNSSVATVPTLLDLILKGKLPEHSLHSGQVIVLASVGAGMNVNSVVYRIP